MFEWEETLFLGVKSAYNRIFVAPGEQRKQLREAKLLPLRGELLWLGRLVSGKAVTLFETDTSALRQGSKIEPPTRYAVSSCPSITIPAELTTGCSREIRK